MDRIIVKGTAYECRRKGSRKWNKGQANEHQNLGRPRLVRGGWSYFDMVVLEKTWEIRVRTDLLEPPKIVRWALRVFDADITKIEEPRRKSYEK